MSKQNILVVCQHYWPESFRINDITDYFIEQGSEVDVLCGLPNYPSGKFPEGYGYFKHRKQEYRGVHIRRALEVPRGNNSNLRILINYLSFPFFSLFHVPRLLTKKYDKIFLYQLSPVMMSFAGIIVGKLRKTETTMYILDLWPENLFSVLPIKNHIGRWLATKISHWHYKKVDKLIVLSEKMKQKLVEVTGISEDRIIVLPQACEKVYEKNIVDASLVKRFKGGFNIVYAGNISPAQSFETVLDAAKQLKAKGLKDIRWIIVGDGMSKSWLENQVKEDDLADSFYFEGQKPVEDVPKYTNIADALLGCLVKSDLLEATIPAKVMSYIAAGKPMVLAMDGETQTLINDTIKCGFAGPTEDSKQLALNITRLYEMGGAERKAMGQRAQNYHFKHFERNIILKKLYSFLFT